MSTSDSIVEQRRQTGGSTAYDEIRRVEAAIRDLLRGGGSQKRLLKLQRRPKR